MRGPNLISLFSGALGLDIGLENAGFNLRALVECNSLAVQTAKENLDRLNANVCIVEEKIGLDNIASVCRTILKETKLKKGEVDLLAGAPPCQPFSTAGKRQSIMDARGDGFAVFLETVRILSPKYFVIENVKGILSAAKEHRPLAQRGPGFPPLKPEEEQGSAFMGILDNIEELCKEMGYCVSWGVLNAADCGSPQSRERLIIIGSLDGQFVWPTLTHSEKGEDGKEKWVTLRKALSGLKDKSPVYRDFSETVSSYLQLIPAGGNWRDLPKEMHQDAIGGAYKSWGGRSGFLRRLAWSKPSPTVTQSPAAKATMLCHPREIRPLTVRECARIQQFPDDWTFSGGMAEQYKQIGNATPVALAEAIGVALIKARRQKKGLHRNELLCADSALLKRIISRPKTTLNPVEMREEKDPEKAKKWLKDSQLGRSGFLKFKAYC